MATWSSQRKSGAYFTDWNNLSFFSNVREWSIPGFIQIILKGNEVMGTESPSTGGVLLSKRDKTMVFIPHPQKVSKYLYLALPSYLKFTILWFKEKKISQVETDRNFLDLS